jgi:phospholipase A1
MKLTKIIITICILIGISIPAFGEYESPLSLYRDNYFITGDDSDQTKFQLSLKYSLLYPSKLGIFGAYTQKSLWKTHDSSSPFYESNYQPEAFVRFESKNNFINDLNLGIIDYIQFSPIYHCSNGQEGIANRSMNTYYGEIQLSIGKVYNLGAAGKMFGYYNTAKENRDIDNYIGHYEVDCFFKIKSPSSFFLDKEEIHVKFGGYGENDTKGWYAIEASVRLVTSVIQPRLFVQYYDGYGEWLINYNQHEQSLRVGLALN